MIFPLSSRVAAVSAALFACVGGFSTSASAATTLLETASTPPGSSNSTIISSLSTNPNSQFQVFTVPTATPDTLFDSFTVFADDFLGTFGGSQFVSAPLSGFLLELDRANGSVDILNSSSPETIAFNTAGNAVVFAELTFEIRNSAGGFFDLTPGQEYAILVSSAASDAEGVDFSTNLRLVPRAASPSLFGLSGGLGLSLEDLANSTNLGSVFAPVPGPTVLETTITLVPEPATAAVTLAALGLLAGRRRRA